jgi:hypothetical protein
MQGDVLPPSLFISAASFEHVVSLRRPWGSDNLGLSSQYYNDRVTKLQLFSKRKVDKKEKEKDPPLPPVFVSLEELITCIRLKMYTLEVMSAFTDW